MGRRRRFKPAALARRAFFFIAGSLLVGFLTVFLEAVMRLYIPRQASVPLAVGISVAATFYVLRLLKHPPLFLRNVPPLAAGLCAGLGVHIARLWIK